MTNLNHDFQILNIEGHACKLSRWSPFLFNLRIVLHTYKLVHVELGITGVK